MTGGHEHHQNGNSPPKQKMKQKIVLIGFLAVAGFFLFTEHRAHLFGILPYLLLLACPLMHMFMHGGYGGHGHPPDGQGRQDEPQQHQDHLSKGEKP